MVRGRLDIRPRDDARASDVESAYGGYIVTKNFKILRRAHRTRRIIDPSFRLRHRTPLRGVGSLPRREYEDDARDVCVRGGVIEIRTNNIFKRTTRKTIST
ncbi:hypothetical protein EVAR_47598_1 [Eumeta japonica]|uniref:Uncharacterized protein n=1 Tax=Eumeta variegata TaxID=151549 RepID=A0A4C1WPL9_EUMVA|nr:hypothetical protein EVAR_47598_1 [Eumeta japonica]